MLCPGARLRTADELLETYVRQLRDARASVPVMQVACQGGEPTLRGVELSLDSVMRALPSLRASGVEFDALTRCPVGVSLA